MRVVVVGAGRMGAIRAEDLAADGRVDDIVIVNRGADRAAVVADQVGGSTAPWPEDVTETSAWPRADAYVVTTATDTHADIIGALAATGRPLLVEKPLAMTLEETDEIIERAGHAVVQIGFQRRFDEGIRGIKERVESGALGTLYTMTMTAHDIAPGRPEFIAGSGGTFRDMLVHDLDLAAWIGGAPIESVYATGTVRHHAAYAEADDFDVVAVHLTLANGVPVLISGTRHDPVGHDIRMEVFGSADSVSAGLDRRTPIRAAAAGVEPVYLAAALCDDDLEPDPYEGFIDRFRRAFAAETSAFVDVVLGERPNPCPPSASRAALAAAVACEISARQGRVVAISEVA